MTTTDRLLDRFRAVDDPVLGQDIVSLGLVRDVHVESDVAIVSLAFNAPLSPAEWTMCDEIRALCRGVGLEPRIYAENDDCDGVPGVKNAIAIGSDDPDAGRSLVTANLATSLTELGARVGVFDCRLDGDADTWLETIELPDFSADRIVPPTVDEPSVVGDVPVVRLGPLIPDRESPPAGATVLELLLPPVLSSLGWGSLDYLLVTLPQGTGQAPQAVVENVPVDGVIPVASADGGASAVQEAIRAFDDLETTLLGAFGTVDRAHDRLVDDDRDWRAARAEAGCPILGVVPRDRSTVTTDESPRSAALPSTVRGDAASPYRDLAVSLMDRVGAVNRQSVVRKQVV